MDNNSIKLSILSSYCWIDPTFKDACIHSSLTEHADFEPISLKQVPPIKRRRLSGLSKPAIHTSLNCIEHAAASPSECMMVFASQHGELNRTITIVDSMYQEHEVSPKDFSLSVHNASLGLYSIFTQNKQPGTSIAAGSNSFGYALIESFNLLQRFPEEKVLLTCSDLAIDSPFAELQHRQYPSYSVSLLLSRFDTDFPNITVSLEAQSERNHPQLPMALEFCDFFYGIKPSTTINTYDTRWDFIKNVE